MTDAERERFTKHSKRNEAERTQRTARRRTRAAASRPLPPVPRGSSTSSPRARPRARHDAYLDELPEWEPGTVAC